MRSFRLFIGVIGLTFLAGVAAQAAELTLDDCINLALKNRESIIRARGAEELAKMGKWAALGAFLPTVQASYDYDRQDIDGTASSTRGGQIGAEIRVSNVVRSALGISAAGAEHSAAKLDVIASEQDLIYAVKVSYYGYLADVQNVSVLEEAVKRSEEQLKLIQSKFDLGSASKSDVLKQKVQSGNDRLELLRAKNSVTTAVSELAYTIGVDPHGDWQFSSKYSIRTFEGPLDSAIAYGLTHRPSVLSLEKNLKSAKVGFTSAKSDYLPTLSVNTGWQRVMPDHGASSTVKSYGYGVSWTLFDGFNREQNYVGAKVAKNNTMASLADARNRMISDVTATYLQINLLKEQKSVAEENVAAATEDLKITQEKYNLGAATILDLLDAQVSLKRAEVSRISADFDLNLAISKLEQSMGKI